MAGSSIFLTTQLSSASYFGLKSIDGVWWMAVRFLMGVEVPVTGLARLALLASEEAVPKQAGVAVLPTGVLAFAHHPELTIRAGLAIA